MFLFYKTALEKKVGCNYNFFFHNIIQKEKSSKNAVLHIKRDSEQVEYARKNILQ